MKKILFIISFAISTIGSFAQVIGTVNYSVTAAPASASGGQGEILQSNNGLVTTITGTYISNGSLVIDSNVINPRVTYTTLDTTVNDTLKPLVGQYTALALTQGNSVHQLVVLLPDPAKTHDGQTVVIKPTASYTGINSVKVLMAGRSVSLLYTITFATNGLTPLYPISFKYSSANAIWQ